MAGSDLPALYLIADVATAQRMEVDLAEVVEEFVRAGGRMVSLRPGRCGGDEELVKLASHLAGLLFATRGVLLIHRRADLALLSGADGIHTPSGGLNMGQIREVMGQSVICGRSCHLGREVAHCDRQGWSFATLGPVFESISKEGYGPSVSPDTFEEISTGVDLPVYALGGVTPDNAPICMRAGAHGVAVVGGILGADSAFEATRHYLDALDVAEDTES